MENYFENRLEEGDEEKDADEDEDVEEEDIKEERWKEANKTGAVQLVAILKTVEDPEPLVLELLDTLCRVFAQCLQDCGRPFIEFQLKYVTLALILFSNS